MLLGKQLTELTDREKGMEPLTLSDLVAGCDGLLTKESNDTPISGISYDSRKGKKGDLFVCISGFVTDGHDYARQA